MLEKEMVNITEIQQTTSQSNPLNSKDLVIEISN